MIMLKPVQVIIGRGRGGSRPVLSAGAWGRFQSRITHYLVFRGEFYRAIEGLGVDMDGGPEQNMTLLGSCAEEYLADFRDFLDHLRVEFEQVVILLIVGELDVIA